MNNKANIEQQIKNWSAAADFAPEKKYQSFDGKLFTEDPGEYNEKMQRQIARDIMTFSFGMKNETRDESMYWMPAVSTLNYDIMRAYDDVLGERPVKAISDKRFVELADSIRKVKASQAYQDSIYENIGEKLDFWLERVLYMQAWYYKLRQLHKIRYDRMEAEMKEYNYDGTELLSGLSEEDEKKVLNWCDIRENLLDLYIRISPSDKAFSEIKDLLEEIEEETETVLDKKGERFVEEPVYDEEEFNNVESVPSELSEVLTAIKVVAGNLKNKIGDTDCSPKTYEELDDTLVTARVMVRRLNNDDMDESSKERFVKYLRNTLIDAIDSIDLIYS